MSDPHRIVTSAVLLVFALALTACAGRPVTPEAAPPAAVVTPSPAELPARSTPPAIIAAPAEGPQAQSPAVLALLAQADAQLQRGEIQQATGSIERALRIAPRDARLWSRLAELRLREGRPEQAEAMAAKSNDLAGPDGALQQRNWLMIAEARRLRGDHAGAQAARVEAAAWAERRAR